MARIDAHRVLITYGETCRMPCVLPHDPPPHSAGRSSGICSDCPMFNPAQMRRSRLAARRRTQQPGRLRYGTQAQVSPASHLCENGHTGLCTATGRVLELAIGAVPALQDDTCSAFGRSARSVPARARDGARGELVQTARLMVRGRQRD